MLPRESQQVAKFFDRHAGRANQRTQRPGRELPVQRDREIRPQIAQYKDDLLAKDYKVVFSQGEYQVLERKDRIQPNSASEL